MIGRIRGFFEPSQEEEVVAARMVVGLGNVGSKYARTRHNLGFEVVAELARRFGASATRNRFDAEVREIPSELGRIVLAAPTTMMNNSGFAVVQLANWYKLDPDQVLVVYDELDLPFGRIRMRPSGGAGGHNGVRSIIDQLGTGAFPRLRVGIGRPTSGSTISYVLSRFTAEQREIVPNIVSLAADASELWLREGLDVAMNEFNRQSVDVRQPSAVGPSENRES